MGQVLATWSLGRSPHTESLLIVGELDDDPEGTASDVTMPTSVPWASRDPDAGKKNHRGTAPCPRGGRIDGSAGFMFVLSQLDKVSMMFYTVLSL